MIKKHKLAAILSSIVTLIPTMFGLIVWNQLPEQLVTHWGFDGTADAISARAWAVFALPLLLLAIHWLCLLISDKIGQPEGQNSKIMGIAFWIIPVISLMANGFTYAFAFGLDFNPLIFLFLIMGVTLIFIGNYMPKIKQNATMGIKIRWTYTSEANWNQTHRIGGKVWVIIGFLCLPFSFLPLRIGLIALPILLAVAIIIPVVYSYNYYKKELIEGKLEPTKKGSPEYQRNKRYTRIGLGGVIALVILFGVIMFTGDVTPRYDEASFTMETSVMNSLTLDYDEIESIAYLDSVPSAQRVMGYGSSRLAVGTFRNDAYGSHTRYTYAQCKAGVVLTANGKTIVINQQTAEETQTLYNELLARCGQ